MKHQNLLIQHTHAIDPRGIRQQGTDILIREGKIADIGPGLSIPAGTRCINGSGLVTLPGFIDIHTHLREPGFEESETIKTGSRAALAGGYTTVLCMANTSPPADCSEIIRDIRQKAEQADGARILPVACATKEMKGNQITDIKALAAAGAAAFSDDGKWIADPNVMQQALVAANDAGKVLISHCEDTGLTGNGLVGEASNLGPEFPEIPDTSESEAARRDIELAVQTRTPLHIAHVSTAQTLEHVRKARAADARITAEVTPHHLTLGPEQIDSNFPDSAFKMKPPLVSMANRNKLKEALDEGLFNAIATDHAPHSPELKKKSFSNAPFGAIGLETAFAVLHTEFVRKKLISLKNLVYLLTYGPSEVIGRPVQGIRQGATADLILVDLERPWTIDRNKLLSKSRNCPFHGKDVVGRVLISISDGILKYERD